MTSDEVLGMTRRVFLRGAGAAAALVAAEPLLTRTAAMSAPQERLWLGPDLWANRLQDWVARGERIECAAPPGDRQGRTVAVLTRTLSAGAATLTMRTGMLQDGGGFSGFLVGVGTAQADPRTAALVISASGTGGGLFCGYDTDGQVRFREHTDERNQFRYAEAPATHTGPAPARRLDEDVELRLTITPNDQDTVTLSLRASDPATGQLLSAARIDDADIATVRGGISLVSSDLQRSGARFWLRGFKAAGAGVDLHPERAWGPVAGTLFTVADATLKMTVQLMPDPTWAGQDVVLQCRAAGGGWRQVGSAPVGPGFTALIRVHGWDASRRYEYRVVPPNGAPYTGSIPAEPSSGRLVIGSINCIKATHRPLDRASDGRPRLPGQSELGLYTDRNLYFPHDRLVAALAAQEPDLLVAHGDQIYEGNPTRKDSSGAPELDFLYKYLLWLWSFRDLTRHTPTVVMVDDHDVYQGNIWGEGGAAASGGPNTGGYVNDAEWVNVVQRVQCGHNPDPFDPTPVQQGISVYYGAFRYGGVSFAIVEDRKFKTGPDGVDDNGQPIPEDELVLLGERQEAFLVAWRDLHPGLPKVLLTQTAWACVQTNEQRQARADDDSGGWPPLARRRAIQIVRDAGALILSGDQHLGSLIRHGLDTHTDGPVQFTAPGGSTSWQRWFEPGQLPNDTGTPHTGDFTDGFGNRFRVLAVANPRFTQAEYRTAYPGSGQDFGDRVLKKEGYGIVHVDTTSRRYRLECWRWEDDPTDPSTQQYPGWPYEFGFDEAPGDGRGLGPKFS